MPPRSVKMKRFIFGFQRRVWWPKWTPASSNCFIVTTATLTPFPSVRRTAGRGTAGGGDRGYARPVDNDPGEVPERPATLPDVVSVLHVRRWERGGPAPVRSCRGGWRDRHRPAPPGRR